MQWTHVIILIALLTLFGCRQPAPFEIKTGSLNQALTEAKNENKNLVAIITMQDCSACAALHEGLYQMAAKIPGLGSFVFYKINIEEPSDKWLEQLYLAKSYPVSCVFSPDGKLLDIINTGNTGKVIKELHALSVNSDSAYRLTRTDLPIQGKAMIAMVDTVWQVYHHMKDTLHKMNADQTKECIKQLEKTIVTSPYFFNNYLLQQLYLKTGDTVAATKYATNALSYTDLLSLVLYREERASLRKFTDPAFAAGQTSVIAFNKTTVDMGAMTAKLAGTSAATFTYYNRGNQPLDIQQIAASCSCVTADWKKKMIPAGDSSQVEIRFNKIKNGQFQYSFNVVSNAANSPTIIDIAGKIF